MAWCGSVAPAEACPWLWRGDSDDEALSWCGPGHGCGSPGHHRLHVLQKLEAAHGCEFGTPLLPDRGLCRGGTGTERTGTRLCSSTPRWGELSPVTLANESERGA
jgi:hypothetical protein